MFSRQEKCPQFGESVKDTLRYLLYYGDLKRANIGIAPNTKKWKWKWMNKQKKIPPRE